MTTSYPEFLDARRQLSDGAGFSPLVMPGHLFDFQAALVDWAVRMGRAGIFADCGLGKTPMELAWADNVHRRTGKPVLIVTPLAVGFQIQAEAAKFDIDAGVSRSGRPADARITITNYERLDTFDPHDFGGVVCDESSAIKSFDGARRAVVTEFMRTRPYRLLCTATAAPNDYVELGTSSEALGHLGHMDMLSRFFTNRERSSSAIGGRWRPRGADQWRFKGHAEQPFWQWVTSWARAIRKPSDLGFDDDRFTLPALTYREHIVDAVRPPDDALFDVPAVGLREEREEARRTLTERCERAAELLADAPLGVAWCHLNDEGRLLARLIGGAVEVAGSDPIDEKEAKLAAFGRGEIRVLVTKPAIGAWGLNWQHCHRMTYFPSHSFEQLYQAVRRSWRFGQTQRVLVDLVTTEGGRNTLANLNRKARQADRMFDALTEHMRSALTVARSDSYDTPVEVPTWATSLTS